jgi:plasmid replication initiation protein
MIREVIRPQYTNITIDIPTSYIGREVEFIMFPLDEQEITKDIKQEKKKSLRGVFNQYADRSKIS